MQLALYRAERPEVFEDIIGQKQIVRILQNQIKTGTVSQAYLFTGTHGTGKTTTARLLAKAVNCLEAEENAEGGYENAGGSVPCGHCANCEAIREGKFVDVIELDAASNNGVDDLRAIIDLVKYPPTIGRYKVYIIDEVHMLSTAAENAFLKTLEEPPEYAIFILATTDPQKVRATIRSRCMQLNFKRVSEDELVAGMQRICDKKGVKLTQDALYTIAAKADGSVRDALSLLEQCLAAGDEELNKALVLEYTGSAGEDFYLALTDAVLDGNIGKAIVYIDEVIKRGKDAKQLLKDWLEHYRNLLVVKYVSKPEKVVKSSAENIARLSGQAGRADIRDIEKAIRLLSEYINIGRYSDRPRILLETAAVRLAGSDGGVQMSELGKTPILTKSAHSPLQQAVRRKEASPEPQTHSRDAESTARTEIAEPETEAIDTEEPQADGPLLQIEAAPRENAGNAREMWMRIVEEIARVEVGFDHVVGKHSTGVSCDGGELSVVIKKNKLNIAADMDAVIQETAKKLYGQNAYVVIRAGDVESAGTVPAKVAPAPTEAAADTSEKAAAESEDSADVGALQNSITNLFGMDAKLV